MILVSDPRRAVPALEEAAAAAVTLVESLRVGVLERVHAVRHVLPWRVDEQVIVIPHRAARVDAPAMTLCDRREERPERVMIEVVAEEVLRSGGMSSDVVQPVGEARTWRPRHAFDGSDRSATDPPPRVNRRTIDTVACLAPTRYVPGTRITGARHCLAAPGVSRTARAPAHPALGLPSLCGRGRRRSGSPPAPAGRRPARAPGIRPFPSGRG